jgi:predicted 3-demethylubiquinone-9 3-methyltransferase (glyoxalase superfamily)
MQKVTPFLWFDGQADPDPDRSRRAMEAMLGMNKIDIAGLEQAANGR